MGDRAVRDETRPRTPFMKWTETAGRLGLALFFLYVFLSGVKSLETGISAFGSDFVDQVFDSVANPIAGLAAGVLATVLVQSSSVTTATIVGLVGSGVLPVDAAVPMVMGANIGTTITNTLASLGHVRQNAYFERALAAATIHDYFNLLSVAILLPLEVAFGLVSRIATWLADLFDGILPAVDTGESPIKDAIAAPVAWVEEVIASMGWGSATGAILLSLGIAAIFLALWMITRQMKAVMSGRIENAINGILAKGAGAGVLSLRNAFPVTLGANVGTTVTALLASIAADSPDALVIAMAHLTFNLLGIIIFYPWPPLRRIPIQLATWTAAAAVRRKSLVAGYVIGLFIVVPVAILLIT
jgi:sodium-dependent phosphate cotransporter